MLALEPLIQGSLFFSLSFIDDGLEDEEEIRFRQSTASSAVRALLDLIYNPDAVAEPLFEAGG